MAKTLREWKDVSSLVVDNKSIEQIRQNSPSKVLWKKWHPITDYFDIYEDKTLKASAPKTTAESYKGVSIYAPYKIESFYKGKTLEQIDKFEMYANISGSIWSKGSSGSAFGTYKDGETPIYDWMGTHYGSQWPKYYHSWYTWFVNSSGGQLGLKGTQWIMTDPNLSQFEFNRLHTWENASQIKSIKFQNINGDGFTSTTIAKCKQNLTRYGFYFYKDYYYYVVYNKDTQEFEWVARVGVDSGIDVTIS